MGITVTVSREMGCHGEWIASEVAGEMSLRLMGSEIIYQAIQAGVPEQVALESEEGRRGWVERAIDFLRGQPASPVTVSLAGTNPIDAYISMGLQQRLDYRSILESMIFDLAQTEDMLLIGRAGQMVLRGKTDTFHVRVWAPLETRVRLIAERFGLADDEARRRIEEADSARATYIRRYYQADIADSRLYDLCVNTGSIAREDAVRLVVQAARVALRLGD